MRWGGMKHSPRLGLLLASAFVVAACPSRSDDVDPEKASAEDDGASKKKNKGKKDKKKGATSSTVDCATYCDKQAACFPHAMGNVRPEAWRKNCAAFCEDDKKRKDPITRLHAAVAACSEARCGDAFGACVEKELDGTKVDIDVAGLHPNCYAFRACIDARVFRFALEEPEIRRTIYAENRAMVANMHKMASYSKVSCKAVVESSMCGNAQPREAEGDPIDVDCNVYCDVMATAFPKYKSDKMIANCEAGCREEAKLGTAVAAFMAAVAACKGKGRGDEMGDCVQTALAKGPNAKWAWDIRELGGACAWFRMCMEAGYLETDPETAVSTRASVYELYGKNFRDLKYSGGDAATSCRASLASLEKCK